MSKHTPGYEVTREGRVFSVATNWRGYGRRELRQTLNADGYPSVRLMVDGKRVRLAVHRLVAAQYLPPKPSPRHEIRHLDGDKSNSCITNLAWGTAKERKMTGPTPGPWKAEGPYHSGWNVVHGSGKEAECVASYCTEQDARLIAAAPDLLAAASALIADVRSRYPGEELRCPYMRALDAAILKATGAA